MRILQKDDPGAIFKTLKSKGVDLDELISSAVSLKKVIVICGPTCTGKSALAVNLAGIFHTDIISVDSMQVYRGMDIGTDKFDTSLSGIKQYMTDIFEPDFNVTAVLFRDMCRKIIRKEFFHRRKIPVLAGGSGLYMRAVTDDLEFTSSAAAGRYIENLFSDSAIFDSFLSKNTRSEIIKEIENEGAGNVYEKLKKIDPEYAQKISKNDTRRIIRALEVFKTTGYPFSNFQKKWNKRNSFYNSTFIGLAREKNILYGCISERVESMFKKGFVSEVERLIKSGHGNSGSILQAVGYREVLKYIGGSITLAGCKEEIKTATKKLAKKQMTWFKADPRINWINTDDYSSISNLLIEVISIIWKDLNYEKN